jgi:hypothetical protein
MADPVTSYLVMKDTTEHAVIKLTAKFDGTTQENNHTRIRANTLYGALNTTGGLLSAGGTRLPYYGLSIHRLWYDCACDGDVQLFWDADTAGMILMLNGNGEYDGAGNWITIPNQTVGTANATGDIGVITRGMTANSSYSIIIEVRKDNAHYQRGQFNDPAAFNYGEYGLKP